MQRLSIARCVGRYSPQKRKWEKQNGRSSDQERYAVRVNSGEADAALDCLCMNMQTSRAASATEIVPSLEPSNGWAGPFKVTSSPITTNLIPCLSPMGTQLSHLTQSCWRSGLAGLLLGMALYWLHVPVLIVVGIYIAPIIVWAAQETLNMFD
jgi:hypothetical protein